MSEFKSIFCQFDNQQEVIDDAIKQLDSVKGDYNFAFIYATDVMANHFEQLLEESKQASKIENWIGSLGAGIVAKNIESYDKPAVSILLANFDTNDYAMLPLIDDIENLSQVKWPNEFFTTVGIVHGDPFFQNTQNLLIDIQKSVEECFLVGGLTSSKDLQYQVSNEIVSKGVSGVFLSENIQVLTGLSQGCSPIGTKLNITQSHKNIISHLDDKPALEALIEAYGYSSIDDLKNHAGGIFLGLCVPHSDQDDYIVRNLIGVDIKDKLFAINDLPVNGSDIIFCERNDTTAVQDMQLMLDKLSIRLKKVNKKPKAGLYISCLGRGRAQFGNNSEEVKMINQTLGDFPITGFFSNGEIHHDKLYGYTGVLTLFL